MIDILFDKFIDTIKNGNMNAIQNGVVITATDLQCCVENNILWFGSVSASLTMCFTNKDVIFTINPTDVQIGSTVRPSAIKISVLNEDFSRLYKLDIDDGELFQLSTIYDFDFLVLKKIMTKYLELLKVLPERKLNLSALDDDMVLEAIENIEKVMNSK